MKTTLSVTLVLMLIFSCHQLVRFFGTSAEGQFPLSIALQLVLVQWPILLGYFLPLFLFLSIIVTYSRLSLSNEMVVLESSGMGRMQLVRITLGFVFLMLLFEGFFVFEAKPWLAHTFEHLRSEALSVTPLQLLTPGRFKVMNGGRVVYYAEEANSARDEMKHLFVAFKNEKRQNSWDVMFAEGGHQYKPNAHAKPFIVLTQGHQYSGVPGQGDYQTTSFSRLAKRVDLEPRALSRNPKYISTHQLWVQRQDSGFAAELHWRIAGVVSMLLLVLLAIPLSKVRPRQGSYTRLMPGILLYVLYVNCLLVARSWLKQGAMSPAWGMWGVHAVMAVVVLLTYVWDDRIRYSAILKKRLGHK
jgi:lipopolysaccharide export system permease protein